ncbi:unnamed protein product [Rhodiola kirilowii]
MEISVRIHSEVAMKFQVPLNGLLLEVSQVKSMIQSFIGIDVNRQKLFFTNHHDILYTPVHDGTLIQSDDINDLSFFSLLIRYPKAIDFPPHQNVLRVLCRLASTKRFEYINVGMRSEVEELKYRIANREMAHPSFYKVYLNGTELDDKWVIGNLKGIYRDDAVIESRLINDEAARMGVAIPNTAVLFSPTQVQIQSSLTVDRSFEEIKTQNFNDLRKQLEEFVSLEDYKVTNIEVLQVSMVEPDLGTPRLDLFVQLPNEGFIFPVEVNATSKMIVLRKEISRFQDVMGFELPSVGYLKNDRNQNIVQEEYSFLAQGVHAGDLIKLFQAAPALQFY